jgi:hypothetical protein
MANKRARSVEVDRLPEVGTLALWHLALWHFGPQLDVTRWHSGTHLTHRQQPCAKANLDRAGQSPTFLDTWLTWDFLKSPFVPKAQRTIGSKLCVCVCVCALQCNPLSTSLPRTCGELDHCTRSAHAIQDKIRGVGNGSGVFSHRDRAAELSPSQSHLVRFQRQAVVAASAPP